MHGKHRAVGVLLGLGLAAAATAAAAPATPQSQFAVGTLNLRGTLRVVSTPVECPSGAPIDAAECRARTGEAPIPGLAVVSESYTWSYEIGPPTCPANLGKPLATNGRLVVAGKGEVHFALAEGVNCVDVEPLRNEPQDFTITGGMGLYAGASGTGTVERSLGGGVGTERWTGTLVAPEVEFDVTPPTLIGAKPKTVRAPKGAKRVRVTYAVSARDDVDGAVPVSCSPRSGTRFQIGRSVVTCSATDASANVRTAKFTITVKPRP
jgi:hypothetical protein